MVRYSQKLKERKVFQMEILRVERLSKIYGDGDNKVLALNDVSFSVE